jgi:hypothetical protein
MALESEPEFLAKKKGREPGVNQYLNVNFRWGWSELGLISRSKTRTCIIGYSRTEPDLGFQFLMELEPF